MQVVQHNLQSMFTGRQLNITTGKQAKSTEKLSSGYRINKAADDAAGLSISEKMRWQIRGLDKGADNISTGISLIQTAEGALNEVHGILQRVRELSVQALNDTNTETDRNAIQKEIDASLNEIDRIRDSTMFNTKPLLKGNPVETIQVTEDTEEEYLVSQYIQKEAPAWLISDKELKSGNVQGLSQLVSQNEIMRSSRAVDKGDGSFEITDMKYYGAQNDSVEEEGFEWTGRQWTKTMNDNPAVKMDFSSFATIDSVEDLYNTLYDLLGTKVSFPCGTCSYEVASIGFGGSIDGMEVLEFKKNATIDATGQVNLTESEFRWKGEEYNGYAEAIYALWDKYAANYDDDDMTDISGETAEARSLGAAIARDLRNRTIDALNEKMRAAHFDRVTANDEFSLAVYDFRDDDILKKELQENGREDYKATVITQSEARLRFPASQLVPGTKVDAETPLKIMCGALKSSYIPLQLPDISLEKMNLSGYCVDCYNEEKHLSDDYKKRVAAWETAGHYEKQTISGTRTVKELDTDASSPAKYGTIYVAGEPQRVQTEKAKTVYKEKTESYSYETETFIHDTPYPVPSEGDMIIEKWYAPSSLYLVDKAIEDVSEARTMLGVQQNRLEYAYNINNNTSENTSSAESRIRDTDMAKEMVDFSKNNILAQAGQSMLVQANQIPQGIMALLG